jgi:membrane protein implicated in regulation of membrane protease activity
MTHKGPTSNVISTEVVGKIGRVLVPTDGASRGKVRVEVKGQLVDYVAASSEQLDQDDVVVVEDYDGGQVRVSKAPKELK